ncbi:hypothetical protein PoB_003027100 [Plakobranchus ocellatus]|uniref:Uncharacterized protein n=1 Tax=Plakobranchus ocellatus TaxID=259542 RepID=A0AAV4AAW2_9GAST|nr:hypothetical protein PoB_003027100 [Plakobranchus ocellatus]
MKSVTKAIAAASIIECLGEILTEATSEDRFTPPVCQWEGSDRLPGGCVLKGKIMERRCERNLETINVYSMLVARENIIMSSSVKVALIFTTMSREDIFEHAAKYGMRTPCAKSPLYHGIPSELRRRINRVASRASQVHQRQLCCWAQAILNLAGRPVDQTYLCL